MLCYYGDDMEEYRRLCRWEDNIKMDLKTTGFNMMNWIESTQDRSVEFIIKFHL